MNTEEKIKLFRFSHEALERDLDAVEARKGIDLGRGRETPADRDDQYYPQFDEAIRKEAEAMAAHYELFYCLESSLRTLIGDVLESKHGPDWWEKAVPDTARAEAKKNKREERDTGVTPRSTEELDYITFGQLGDIVRSNWESFGDMFSSERAFTHVMARLNTLRGPIAHCCALSPDEALRLELTVKDWFRLMS